LSIRNFRNIFLTRRISQDFPWTACSTIDQIQLCFLISVVLTLWISKSYSSFKFFTLALSRGEFFKIVRLNELSKFKWSCVVISDISIFNVFNLKILWFIQNHTYFYWLGVKHVLFTLQKCLHLNVLNQVSLTSYFRVLFTVFVFKINHYWWTWTSDSVSTELLFLILLFFKFHDLITKWTLATELLVLCPSFASFLNWAFLSFVK